MNAPCKDCVERTVVCHDSCERYQAYNLERVKIREAREQERIRSKKYKALVPYRIRGEQ